MCKLLRTILIKQRIYLDHAATSPLRPEARAAMEDGFALWANPSSPHGEGRKAKQALEDARDRIKRALKWDGELIFTSGASEALAIGLQRSKASRKIVSAVEHDAVFRSVPGAEVVEPETRFDGDAVLAVQHVNSETGTINPVAQMTRHHPRGGRGVAVGLRAIGWKARSARCRYAGGFGA